MLAGEFTYSLSENFFARLRMLAGDESKTKAPDAGSIEMPNLVAITNLPRPWRATALAICGAKGQASAEGF